jgi:hypothetical protein
VRASPDVYSLLLIAPARTTNATLYEKLNFNFIADIVPIASFVRSPYLMVVNPSVPAPRLISVRESKRLLNICDHNRGGTTICWKITE